MWIRLKCVSSIAQCGFRVLEVCFTHAEKMLIQRARMLTYDDFVVAIYNLIGEVKGRLGIFVRQIGYSWQFI